MQYKIRRLYMFGLLLKQTIHIENQSRLYNRIELDSNGVTDRERCQSIFLYAIFFSWREHSKTTVCEYRIQTPDKLFKLLRRAKINRLHAEFVRIKTSTSFKGELTCQLRILFSSTQIPIQ